jgi:RNA polymerase sigma-70 factor (ECF subfamily)
MRIGRRKYQQYSDEELLKLFPKEPMKIIEELYRRYSVLCYGLAIKYLQNRPEAKDAVNDIFIRLRFDLDKNEVRSFRSWFYTYSKNHCLGALRKRKPAPELSREWVNQPSESLDEKMKAEKNILDLEEAMKELKSDQAACVRAFYFKKKSYEEISNEYGFSVKQVKSHLQNARRNLKMKLQKGGMETRVRS